MAKWAPEKSDTLDAIAREILHNYGRGRAIVAIDGAPGAGAAGFADDLADTLRESGTEVFRGSLDRFQRPRAERFHRGPASAEGYYLDTFDYSMLRRVLLDPFRLGLGAAFVTAAFDAERDTPIEPRWTTAPPDAILLIDGVFLLRPDLRGAWNYSVRVEADAAVQAERLATDNERLGELAPVERFTGGEALYRAEASPRTAAVAIVDNTDPEHPRRVFADSC